MLHPSHSFTGWSHFHNRSLDTFPALSAALPKHLETICHLPHQHTAIALSPQHTNLLRLLLLPALPPTTLGRTKHLEQLLSTASQEKQGGRAISPSVCLFVIEEQPNLTGPGSFTSSSRPPAWFWLQPEQVIGTRPRRAAAQPCCTAQHTSTQAQWDPGEKRHSLLHHSRAHYNHLPLCSRWARARLVPRRRAQEPILGAIIAQVLSLQEWKWSKARLSLAPPPPEQASSCHTGSGKCS